MLRRTVFRLSISAVAIRPGAAVTAYTPTYRASGRVALSHKYDRVSDLNRYEALSVLLGTLSRHVGRRQVRMQNNLNKYLDGFKSQGVDWHDLKAMDPEGRRDLLLNKLNMTHAEHVIIQTALEACVCGVLTKGSSKDPGAICLRRGYADHGWRCGVGDHSDRCYFEDKQLAPQSRALLLPEPSTKALRHRAEAIEYLKRHSGDSADTSVVEHVASLDFSVAGRLHHDVHPRVWSRPHDPTFVITPMGFEFFVHPRDPRSDPQIVQAREEWAVHANVITQVLWEQLEERAVDRRTDQPLDLAPGDVPRDDAAVAALSTVFSTVDPETGVTVERRMTWKDGGDSIPWFTPSPPRRWSDTGIPEHIPYAPSIAIKCMYRVPPNTSPEGRLHYLRQPLVELTLHVHPKACFYWPDEAREAVLRETLTFASKMPFALPWTLYLRVDTAKRMRTEPTLEQRKEELMKERGTLFDLSTYTSRREGDDGDGGAATAERDGVQDDTPIDVVFPSDDDASMSAAADMPPLPGPADWR